MKLILEKIVFFLSLNSFLDNPDLIRHSFSYLLNSSLIKEGAKIIDIQGQILWVKYISFPSVNTIISLLQTLKRSFSIIVDGVEIVDKILAITKSNDYSTNTEIQAEVKGYEKQIDQMVYKLYDLTPEEIEIVGEGIK